MSDTIIEKGMILPMDPKGKVIREGYVAITKGKITEVAEGPVPASKGGAQTKRIDASGCVVMPGFINLHTHVPMALLRGVAEDLPLMRWLMEKIFPLEQKWVNEAFVECGSLLSSMEMIRSGTTTFNDMYYFSDIVGKAATQAGLRAHCGQAYIEINPVEEMKTSIATRFDPFLEKMKSYPTARASIAPHAIYSVSRQKFQEIIEYSEKNDLLIHIHLSETQDENDQCIKMTGQTPTEFLDSLGFWKQKVIAAHATCLTEKDIEILGKNRIGISHNPESNLKLGTKIAPIKKLREAGAHVGIGTDSVASNNNLDLLQEIDFAAKLQAYVSGPGALTPLQAVRMLTIEGAKALRRESEIGSLEAGKQADVTILNFNQSHLVPMYDPYAHLVYSATGADVRSVMVGGKLLLDQGKILTIDESAVIAEAVQWSKKILDSSGA